MPEAYPVISGRGRHVGGAELQSWIIAKELAEDPKFKVYFIVRAFEDGTEIINNVIVFKINYKEPTIGYLKILKAMVKINADVYYQRTGGVATIFVSFFCKIFKKRFIFHVSRDEQLDNGYPYNKSTIIKKLYRISINLADFIIVQNKIQKKKVLYKKSFIIPNAIEDVEIDKTSKKEDFILWVATITDLKRPELFIELAKKIPKYNFIMIGGTSNKNLYKKIKSNEKKLKNIKIIGFKPLKEVEEYFKRAKIFINTSILEGFPNTFLQAWKYGTPVVSLDIDPDEIICKYKLGFHSKSFEKMVKDVERLYEDIKLYKKISIRCRRFILKFDVKRLISKYKEILLIDV